MKPPRLCHVIHPGIVDPASDLSVAQPVTFATMEAARAFAGGEAEVEVRAVLFRDEAHMPLPPAFLKRPGLDRSVADLKPFRRARKLALLRDVLDAGLEGCAAEFVVYTNVDIALQPHFYATVAALIRLGYDAFVINRRTIPAASVDLADLPLMYAELGEPHPGYDCFVFRRDLYPRFTLGEVCIGTAWVGRALLANLAVHGARFREHRDLHLTFHLGDSLSWRNGEFSDYLQANREEYLRIASTLEREAGGFSAEFRSYLLDAGPQRSIPDFDRFFISAGRCLPLEAT